MVIRLYNTFSNRKEELTPREPGRVKMYHCGPTVYSSPHIGNFRAFLLADLMRRFFADQGLEVEQVMNVTDVGHMTADDEDRGEDKMQAAARRENLDPWQIARRYEAEFRAAMTALHFEMPHHLPRATDHIAEMGAIIDVLLERGHAYQVDGNVYFEISTFPAYGRLSGKVLDELEEGARVAVNAQKRDPRDFALWKTDDKHLMQWDAPFRGGVRGFPGWHIECSAMAIKYLGESFDIHTGGEDNLFPHHECEVAQSEAFSGRQFAHTWLHVKHLLVEGKKMSKSLGNFVTVAAVLEAGYTGAELRYVLLKAQYRQSLNFTWAGLKDARASIERVRRAWGKAVEAASDRAGGEDLSVAVDRADAGFTAALSDDLNTSEALAAVFGLVSAVNRATPDAASAAAAVAAFARFQRVLGVFGGPILTAQARLGRSGRVDADATLSNPRVQALAEARQTARDNKDFAAADQLRAEIEAAGFRVVDTPTGPRLEAL